jgi:hypothetical protein
LAEHAVKADQYIPAIVCELTETDTVVLVTVDGKLRRIVHTITERHDFIERVTLADPLTVL